MHRITLSVSTLLVLFSTQCRAEIIVAGLDSTIRHFAADGTQLASHSIGFRAGAIDYNPTDGKLYFGMYTGATAQRGAWSMNLDGTGLTQLFQASGTARSATVDHINGFMFVDIFGGTDDGIWRMNLDGSGATRIDNTFVAGSIGGLKANPFTQTLYIGDHSGGQSLKTMDYNGGNQNTLHSGLNGNLHEMDIDYVNEKLYLVSNGAGPIYKMDLDGSNLETFADSLNNPLGVAVDSAGGFVYVGEAGGGVERFNLDGTGRTQWITSPQAFGLAFVTAAVPEPSSFILLLGSAVPFVTRRRRSRRERTCLPLSSVS